MVKQMLGTWRVCCSCALVTRTLGLAVGTLYPGSTRIQLFGRKRQLQRKVFDLPIGAGEGIRTLDPNLGKVVLYP